MELKLARAELDAKPKTISLEKIEGAALKDGGKIFYFDRDNSHKQLIALVEHFENKGLSVYHRTVKYGLDENDYMYEVHIL
ncbi:HP0268 family nuclease [Campylobacter devanensis]|uniref:HP0268 family nuclease n=1 Tax=Campylobacter devanensis TaxID=3161138 RepID=UPI000A32EC8E|nr:HP0268 family nuclease [Campylobacter sp. P0106]